MEYGLMTWSRLVSERPQTLHEILLCLVEDYADEFARDELNWLSRACGRDLVEFEDDQVLRCVARVL